MAAERQPGQGPVFATAENATDERQQDFWDVTGCYERKHTQKKKNINALTPMRTNVNIHILVYKHENKKENGWRDELGSKK